MGPFFGLHLVLTPLSWAHPGNHLGGRKAKREKEKEKCLNFYLIKASTGASLSVSPIRPYLSAYQLPRSFAKAAGVGRVISLFYMVVLEIPSDQSRRETPRLISARSPEKVKSKSSLCLLLLSPSGVNFWALLTSGSTLVIGRQDHWSVDTALHRFFVMRNTQCSG